MECLRLEPLELPLSRLAPGTLGFSPITRDRDYAVLDAWVEAGGTVIDTAHVYDDGGAERLLGLWLRDRPGVRERLVIVNEGRASVGQLIDALDAHRRAGDIRAYGVSNWTLPRIEDANAYAAAHGVAGICCNSPPSRSRSRTSRRGRTACPRPTPRRAPGTPAPGRR